MLTSLTTDPPMDRCRIVCLHHRPRHCVHACLVGVGPPDEAKSQGLGRFGIYSPAHV
jgi:hypothetical protein